MTLSTSTIGGGVTTGLAGVAVRVVPAVPYGDARTGVWRLMRKRKIILRIGHQAMVSGKEGGSCVDHYT